MLEQRLEDVRALSNAGEAQAAHDLALELAKSFQADVRVQLAAAYACDRLGHETDSITYYERALKIGIPENELTKFAVCYGSALRNAGRLEEAVTWLSRAARQYPDRPVVLAFLALAYFSDGQAEQAFVALLDAALRDNPEGFEGYARALREYRDELAALVTDPVVGPQR